MATPNIISYYASIRTRNGHKERVYQFHAVRDDATIKTVDTTRGIIKHNLTFGSAPHELFPSDKKTFEEKLNEVLNS